MKSADECTGCDKYYQLLSSNDTMLQMEIISKYKNTIKKLLKKLGGGLFGSEEDNDDDDDEFGRDFF
ncbi:hypothetical protein DERP_000645 [Dermatophagoides pteronyssinus]|uniref:Uncharacterized protein n=1 Tax=Dermatophagoides pteronyssinus TaxID=6956 RepID=A0ABQ8J0U6_DERPT|nr:hypothetical protein DERP_000645 [Dermatophagoides pteronyssinus]